MKYEIRVLRDSFPRLFEVISDELYDGVRFVESPFGNCQSFCMSMAKEFNRLEDDDILILLKDIYKRFERKQMIIDLRSEDSDKVLQKLRPFTTDIISTPYKSTNDSDMIMHIIQLDYIKLSEQ